MTRVLLLVGSTRDGGFNQRLAETATSMLREHVTVDTFTDLASLPHLREDLDEPGRDEVVDAFRLAVRTADALLLVTPEYNGGPPSLIKNALDNASRPHEDIPIAGKPTAVIGATPPEAQPPARARRCCAVSAWPAPRRSPRPTGSAPPSATWATTATTKRHRMESTWSSNPSWEPFTPEPIGAPAVRR